MKMKFWIKYLVYKNKNDIINRAYINNYKINIIKSRINFKMKTLKFKMLIKVRFKVSIFFFKLY